MEPIWRVVRIKILLPHRGLDKECGSIIFIPELPKLAF